MNVLGFFAEGEKEIATEFHKLESEFGNASKFMVSNTTTTNSSLHVQAAHVESTFEKWWAGTVVPKIQSQTVYIETDWTSIKDEFAKQLKGI